MYSYKDRTGKEFKFRPGNLAEEYRAWAQARGLGGHYGTTEGALKGWDTRGRGRKEPEKKPTDLNVAPLKNDKYFGFRTKVGRELKNNVDISLLSEKHRPVLTKHVNNLQEKCKEIGLPEIRGVVVIKDVDYMASMGDGILSINRDAYETDPQTEIERRINVGKARIEEFNKRLKENEKEAAKRKRDWEEKNKDLVEKGVKFEDSPDFIFWNPYHSEQNEICKRGIEKNKKYVEALQTRGIGAIQSDWKPGEPLGKRVFSSEEYFDFKDRPKIILDHEFGHHIHQQMGVNAKNWKNPPMEKDIHDIFWHLIT